jgi:hypothetical protein
MPSQRRVKRVIYKIRVYHLLICYAILISYSESAINLTLCKASVSLPVISCVTKQIQYHLNIICNTLTEWFRFNYKNNQQGALYRLIYYSKSILHVSGDVFVHHQKHLTVFTVFTELCCSWGVYTPHEQHSSDSTHSKHQPAATWMNAVRYCKYNLGWSPTWCTKFLFIYI